MDFSQERCKQKLSRMSGEREVSGGGGGEEGVGGELEE